jgi:hypothetical protein
LGSRYTTSYSQTKGLFYFLIIIIIIIIIIRDNEKRTCMLIDVAIPGVRNVTQKEAEKISKYKDLTIEIQRTWIVKTRVMPVITGATRAISKSFRKYVSTIPEIHEVREIQKTGRCTHTSKSAAVK